MRHILYSMALFAALSAVFSVLTTGAAMAQTCPASPDLIDDQTMLLQDLQNAQDAGQAKLISGQLWALWSMAPNEQAQSILDTGMTRFRAYDYAGAIKEFDRLVDYCPAYAEGYNQRAFVNYLRQDYDAALVDLDRAIDLSPHHIGAVSGRALTLMGLGRTDEARTAMLAAIALNPWLPERALVDPGGPLAPLGTDL